MVNFKKNLAGAFPEPSVNWLMVLEIV